MRGLLFSIILIQFCFYNRDVRAQFNDCLQRIELLQLQAFNLTNASEMMRKKSWMFDGVMEAASPSASIYASVNQAVVWKSPTHNERVYFYDNEERPNYVVALLVEDCYKALITAFSENYNRYTLVLEGKLVTTFVIDEVVIEFIEGVKKNFEVRLYLESDKEKFYELISFHPNSGGGNNGTGSGVDPVSGISWSLNGRTLKSTPRVTGTAADEGTVVVDVWVDANGNVTKAIANAAKSNTSNGTLFKMAEEAAHKVKFSALDADKEQIGSIKITFRLN